MPSEVQRCPAVPKPPNSAPSTARSTSASSITTIGFLPPSSRHGDCRWRPHSSPIFEPTALEPVKPTLSTRPLLERALEARERLRRPSAWTTLSTPPGTPPAWKSLASASPSAARVLGRLPDDRVAAQDRRHEVPGRHGDGEVAGGDDRGDADRHAEREELLVRHLRRHGLAVEAPALAEEEVARVDDLLHLAERLGVRLADLARDEPRRAPPCWPRPAGRPARSRARAPARAPAAHSRCAARAARRRRRRWTASPSSTSATTSEVLAGLVEVRRPPGRRRAASPSTMEAISVAAIVVMRPRYCDRRPRCRRLARSRGRRTGRGRASTRSASMPGLRRPRSSLPSSQAGVTVSASSAACRSSASCGRHSRRTASRRPWSGSISSTGASRAEREPRAGRVQRAVGVGALEPVGPQALGDGASVTAIDGWIDAVTPSCAKRGMSSGCRHCACSIRGRMASGTASKTSSASRLARSPIACTATGTPAAVAARTISSNSSRLVISTPLPSSSRAVLRSRACRPCTP